MSRRRVAIVVVAAAVVSAAAVVLAVVLGGRDASVPPPVDQPVAYAAKLEPERVLFGDTVVAELELTVDRGIVVPETVRVTPDFTPFRRLGSAEMTRRDLGDTTVLTYRYTLACLDRACAVGGRERILELPLSLFHYADPRFGAATESIDWPELTVVSRLAGGELADADLGLPEDPLPAASYGVSPTLLGWAFVAIAAAIVLLAGGLLARRLWRSAPQRREAVRPEPSGSPLARAIELLEAALGGSEEERRTSADEFARALDAEGHRELAGRARRLAWSKEPPGAADSEELAAAARQLIAEAA